jgi:hypothetical protein
MCCAPIKAPLPSGIMAGRGPGIDPAAVGISTPETAAIIELAPFRDWVLLGRFSWVPGLRWIIRAAGLVAAAGLLIPARTLGRAEVVTAAVAVLAVGAGSAAWV